MSERQWWLDRLAALKASGYEREVAAIADALLAVVEADNAAAGCPMGCGAGPEPTARPAQAVKLPLLTRLADALEDAAASVQGMYDPADEDDPAPDCIVEWLALAAEARSTRTEREPDA